MEQLNNLQLSYLTLTAYFICMGFMISSLIYFNSTGQMWAFIIMPIGFFILSGMVMKLFIIFKTKHIKEYERYKKAYSQ